MADDETGAKKQKRVQIQVKLDEEVAEGSYVNMARIFHNQTEFVVDALFLPPQSKQATVRARLIMSPAHAKFLHAALTRNLEIFENQFGPITPGTGANDPGSVMH